MDWNGNITANECKVKSKIFPTQCCSLSVAMLLLFPSLLWSQQPFDIKRVKSSVVRVIASNGNSIGSGSLIKVNENRGYILTAYHVIQHDLDNSKDTVKVELSTEHTLIARISPMRINQDNDIAVLIVESISRQTIVEEVNRLVTERSKISDTRKREEISRKIEGLNQDRTMFNLPMLAPPEIFWASATDLVELEKVYSIGHPIGFPGWQVTEASVSSIQGGKIYFSGNAVNLGNSGGPLLNQNGEMLGLNLRLGGGLGIALEGDIVKTIIRNWVPNLTPKTSRPSTK